MVVSLSFLSPSPSSSTHLLGCVVEVRSVAQRRGLFLDGSHPLGMRVPNDVDRDASREVQVTTAVGVDEERAFSAREHDVRGTRVGLEDVLLLVGDHLVYVGVGGCGWGGGC
jgi:hypothetical protein